MYYFISVIMISMLPTGEPLLERSVTGPFLSKEDCAIYSNIIYDIARQTEETNIIDSECREKDKGKAV